MLRELIMEAIDTKSESVAEPSTDWLTASVMVALSLVACWLGLWSMGPPAPVGAEAPAGQFSAERAKAHVQVLAASPRPLGSEGHRRARQYIVEQLEASGWDVEIQKATVLRRWDYQLRMVELENIVARSADSDQPDTLLASHYDSVEQSPGAADAASGVAALLETARALAAGGEPLRDVILLVTDGEETGLFGARAFVDEHPAAQGVGVVFNFEARGSAGASFMFESAGGSLPLVRALRRGVPHAVAVSFTDEVYQRMPNDTDFSVLKALGGGLNFAFFKDPFSYHSSLDTAEQLDLPSLQHHGEQALGLARHFAEPGAFESLADDRRAIFFNAPGGLVVYPETWAIPLALVLVFGVLWVLISALRSGRVTWGRTFAGLVGFGVTAMVTGAVVFLMTRLSEGLIGHWRLVRWADLDAFFVAGLAWIIAIGLSLIGWAVRRWGWEPVALGQLVGWTLLALGSALVVPGASYLFLAPTMAAAVALGFSGPGRPSLWVGAPLALTLGFFWGPVIPLLAIALDSAAVLPVGFLGALVLALFIPFLGDSIVRGRRPAGVGAALAVLAMLFGLGTQRFDAQHPRVDSLVYVLDLESSAAQWGTFHQPSEWTAPRVSGAERQTLDGFFGRGRNRLFVGPAETVGLAAPSVEIPRAAEGEIESSEVGHGGPWRGRIVPGDGAAALWIHLESEGPLGRVRIRGQEIPLDDAGDGTRMTLVYHGPPAEGLDLEIDPWTPGLELAVVDQDFGLPEGLIAQGGARPAHLRPSPYGPSDATFVRQVFDL